MTAEQLQNARAAAWRQDGNALLSADDAAAWLREVGLALFLPRTAQIAAPAGSFVEATIGEPNPTPSASAISNGLGILHRLLASGDAVALSLLGLPGDQPDFIATPETLPFIYSLRGDKEWKRGPRGKSSPLVVEVWKVLDQQGALTAEEVKSALGRQLTESAALRALNELWSTLRIEPIYTANGASTSETHWQLLQGNHEKAMAEGSAMGNSTALSALVSLYLQASIAATSDEIEAFLSPLASRSRIRDAVNGLHGTRQLGLRNLGPREHFYVEGSLPDFPEATHANQHEAPETASAERKSVTAAIPDMIPELAAEEPEQPKQPTTIQAGAFQIEALSEDETERERTVGEGRKRFVAQRSAQNSDRKTYGNRPGNSRPGARPGPYSSVDRPAAGRGAAGPKKPFFAREPWKEDRRPGAPNAGDGASDRKPFGDRKPFAPREGGDRKPFTPREGGRPAFGGERKSFGDRKPFVPREGGDRKPFAPREGGRPSFGGERKSFGDRKPSTPRQGGDRKPFTPREDSDRKPFTPREGGRPAFGGERKSFGDRKPFTSREGGDRKPFTSREGGERKPFTPREGGRPPFGGERKSFGDRKPFTPREGGDRKPFTPRDGGRPSFGGERKSFGDRKPFTPRESGDRKPFTPREGGRPSFGGDRKPFTPRPGGSFGGARPAANESGGFDSPRRTGKPGVAPKRFSPAAGRPSRPGAPAGPAKAGKRPRTAGFTSTGQPRAGVGKTGRPGPKFGAKSAGKFGARPGKPASGRKPGAGPRKPGGKGSRPSA